MVHINITEEDSVVILDCYKGINYEEYFRLVVDKNTRKVIEKPENSDIDVSAAYSHVYMMLKNGIPLPESTVAAWG
jgi:hypothetical protein